MACVALKGCFVKPRVLRALLNVQAATADQSASLKRLQGQLSSMTLGSGQWPTQDRKWDPFESGIPAAPGGSEQGHGTLHASLRNPSLPSSRSASPSTFAGQVWPLASLSFGCVSVQYRLCSPTVMEKRGRSVKAGSSGCGSNRATLRLTWG
jgi:hypothetical protein